MKLFPADIVKTLGLTNSTLKALAHEMRIVQGHTNVDTQQTCQIKIIAIMTTPFMKI